MTDKPFEPGDTSPPEMSTQRSAFFSGVFGTDGDDVLVGTRGNDVIYAFDGDDSIRGGAGYDVAILADHYRHTEVRVHFDSSFVTVVSTRNRETREDRVYSDVELLQLEGGATTALFRDGTNITAAVTRDANGELLQRSVINANDLVVNTHYEDGRVISSSFVDATDQHEWSSITSQFGSDGQLRSRTVELDMGLSVTSSIDSWGRISRNYRSDGDEYDWISLWTQHVDGNLRSISVEYEFDAEYLDGIRYLRREFTEDGILSYIRYEYQDGCTVRSTITDEHRTLEIELGSGRYNVHNGEYHFDGDGTCVLADVELLNGTMSKMVFDGESRSLELHDRADVYDWWYRYNVRDADGNLQSVRIEYDYGLSDVVWVNREYDDGVLALSTALRIDRSTVAASFEDGVMVERVVTQADGDSVTFRFSDGARSVTHADGADDEAYTTRTFTYDDTNRLTSREIVFDNGDAISLTFHDDGSRTRVATDGDDSHAWTTHTQVWDASGDLVSNDFV